MPEGPQHFKGKEAIEHVAEAQVNGMISAAEIHGTEIPGHVSAAADACRDTCVIFLLLLPLIVHLKLLPSIIPFLGALLLGWTLWRIGRASWLGWSRLERLHRVLEQEKWEIEHNRPQERDELKELYRAKGFEGKLLEDVLDVLMADSDRLLRVMVEEELGLSLQKLEHPLKQGVGAGIGAFLSSLGLLLSLTFLGPYGALALALILIACSGAAIAAYARNKIIPAVTWNASLAILALGFTFFVIQLLS